MTITDKAKKYSDMFVSSTRDNGESYVYLKDEASEKLKDSVHEAHGDSLPDDWIYGTYADLMQKITEYELKTIDDLENVRHEIVDSYVDIYTADLTKWLASDIRNVHYLSDAISEGIADDGFQLLTGAQFLAIDNVMNYVVELLS